ncbi:DUF58 domain-containing protein, partial [Aetokthonos hydrillicola CCALA 1050]|nr:DUF58 domain-containing protein [Aetokthonos hydrillicola CCALA 1050]
MVPSRRLYLLLVLGVGLASILAIFVGVTVSIAVGLLYDAIALGLMVVDALRVRSSRVEITRELPSRLSIGRDNLVVLKVKLTNSNALIEICDYYPSDFKVSAPKLRAFISDNIEPLQYTVHPTQRGEYSWGDIHVRQLGRWGLAWNDFKIPQSVKVKVYPDLIGLRSLSIRLTLQSSGSI